MLFRSHIFVLYLVCTLCPEERTNRRIVVDGCWQALVIGRQLEALG